VAEIDPTDNTRSVKPAPVFPRAFLRRGEMYFLEDLVAWFSKRTISQWAEAFRKLKSSELIKQPGTKRAFVISDDLFDLFALWGNE
jgi:hypothetical protein